MSEEPVEENETGTENKLQCAVWLRKQLEDVPDQILKPERINFETPPTVFSLILILLGITLYVADVGSDLYLAFRYLNNGQLLYFKLTLTFVFLPLAVLFVISMLSISAEKNRKETCCGTILMLFLLALVCTDAAAFFYGLKCRKIGYHTSSRQNDYILMIKHSSGSSSSSKLFETFLEAAPQATLQTYILIVQQQDGNGPSAWQFISLGLSLFGLAWTLASHTRRMLPVNGFPMMVAYIGTFVECLGYFLLNISRCFALAAFASIHSSNYVMAYIVIYFLVMWIFTLAAHEVWTWGTSPVGIFLNAAACVVVTWIYCFQLFHFDQFFSFISKKLYVSYYVLVFIINSFALFVWLRSKIESSGGDQLNLAIAKVVVNFVLFFCGVSCLVLYNIKYHHLNIPGNYCADNILVKKFKSLPCSLEVLQKQANQSRRNTFP